MSPNSDKEKSENGFTPQLKPLDLKRLMEDGGWEVNPEPLNLKEISENLDSVINQDDVAFIEDWCNNLAFDDDFDKDFYKILAKLTKGFIDQSPRNKDIVYGFETDMLVKLQPKYDDKHPIKPDALKKRLAHIIDIQLNPPETGIQQYACAYKKKMNEYPILCKVQKKAGAPTKFFFVKLPIAIPKSSEIKKQSSEVFPSGKIPQHRLWTILRRQSNLATVLIISVAMSILFSGSGLWLAINAMHNQHKELRSVIPQIGGPNNATLVSITHDNKTSYILLIHPRGWQDTGIKVKKGDQFRIHALGEINIGPDWLTLYENADLLKRVFKGEKDIQLKQDLPTGWKWITHEGYNTLDYMKNKEPNDWQNDETLITNKYPYGQLIGYVSTGHINPVAKVIGEKPRAGATLDSKLLVDFSQRTVQINEAGLDSSLYLAVNDSISPEWQYDNFGFFLVHLIRE